MKKTVVTITLEETEFFNLCYFLGVAEGSLQKQQELVTAQNCKRCFYAVARTAHFKDFDPAALIDPTFPPPAV